VNEQGYLKVMELHIRVHDSRREEREALEQEIKALKTRLVELQERYQAVKNEESHSNPGTKRRQLLDWMIEQGEEKLEGMTCKQIADAAGGLSPSTVYGQIRYFKRMASAINRRKGENP